MKHLNIFSLTLALCLSSGVASALPTGDQIANNINQRDEGISVARDLQMKMVDRRGKTRIRETRTFRKYYGEDKRTAIFYKTPKNIKDTAFLTLDYADNTQEDDQWLYLPSARKVRRISASDRGDYFLGTDFTYEEIKLETRVSIGDYQRTTLREDEADGFHCYLVEARTIDAATTKDLGHSRREDCIDDNVWMIRRSVIWDEKGHKLKTIYFRDIALVQGIWTAREIHIDNHRNQHKTTFTFSNINYETPVEDSRFTKNAIKRGL